MEKVAISFESGKIGNICIKVLTGKISFLEERYLILGVKEGYFTPVIVGIEIYRRIKVLQSYFNYMLH